MTSIKSEYKDWVEYRNEQGQLHRTDGPAVEWKNGHKEWWINGQLHREDGPAVKYGDGRVSWYLNNINYSEQEWEQEVTRLKLKRILDL
jgi:hypothetical protein